MALLTEIRTADELVTASATPGTTSVARRLV
jgi:hypothetical protein